MSVEPRSVLHETMLGFGLVLGCVDCCNSASSCILFCFESYYVSLYLAFSDGLVMSISFVMLDIMNFIYVEWKRDLLHINVFILPLCPINSFMLWIFMHHGHLTPFFTLKAHVFFQSDDVFKKKNLPYFPRNVFSKRV